MIHLRDSILLIHFESVKTKSYFQARLEKFQVRKFFSRDVKVDQGSVVLEAIWSTSCGIKIFINSHTATEIFILTKFEKREVNAFLPWFYFVIMEGSRKISAFVIKHKNHDCQSLFQFSLQLGVFEISNYF